MSSKTFRKLSHRSRKTKLRRDTAQDDLDDGDSPLRRAYYAGWKARGFLETTGESNHRRRYNINVSSLHSESTEEEEPKHWDQPVVCCQCSDTGEKCTVEVDFVHPKVRECLMDRLNHKTPIHFGTKQNGGQIHTYQRATVRSTDMTLQGKTAPKDLDVDAMMVTLNKVVIPRTRELQQRLGVVNNFVGAESLDGRPYVVQPLGLKERRGSHEKPQPSWENGQRSEKEKKDCWDPPSRDPGKVPPGNRSVSEGKGKGKLDPANR